MAPLPSVTYILLGGCGSRGHCEASSGSWEKLWSPFLLEQGPKAGRLLPPCYLMIPISPWSVCYKQNRELNVDASSDVQHIDLQFHSFNHWFDLRIHQTASRVITVSWGCVPHIQMSRISSFSWSCSEKWWVWHLPSEISILALEISADPSTLSEAGDWSAPADHSFGILHWVNLVILHPAIEHEVVNGEASSGA